MTTTKQALLDRAHSLYEEKYPEGRLWRGGVGESLTGEQVAVHADAAAEYIAEVDWKVPDPFRRGTPGAAADEQTHTESTRYVVGAIIELLLRAEAGAPYADAWAWYLQPGLTADEAREMYHDVAAFARRYGPEAA
ncbi:hypothetical protein ACH4FX_39065 [Streptomyces sp. NPDC018019]|uniref:hypothetical protein n=1 Tax=Streptomyces sp. NPDC018019 TaxID=3365030 RepID=UPI0037897534